MGFRTVVMVGALLALLALGGCLFTEQEPPEDVKEIRIVASRFHYEPGEIHVKQGQKVRIIGTSADVPHGLAIMGYPVSLYLTQGGEQSAEFIADKKGTFPFSCMIPCGSGHGSMQGVLIVE